MDEEFKNNLLKNDFNEILGQDSVKKQLKSALLMDRHIILVGPPGVGKTTIAKNILEFIPEKTVNDCQFHCSPEDIYTMCPNCRENGKKQNKIKLKKEDLFIRVQGSPDLTAEDLIGDIDPIKALKYGPLSIEAFTPGKIFKANNGILFFDEINRCSEKLQNALLQVLEEKKVTIGSYNIDFKSEFLFIGTMNPEDTSTEPLSDVFLDRFDLIYMTYPESEEIEQKIVEMKSKQIVNCPLELRNLIVKIVRNLRNDERLEKKPSVRATIGIYERSQSNALVNKRKTVTIDDIKEVIASVLSHRIKLKPSVKYLETPEQLIKEEVEKTLKRGGYL
ncbi:MAG: ATP-binding protein [Candidatus Woesearchaeota archaeon]